MTKPSELRALGDDELEARLGEARQELFNLRFQAVTGQLDNTARLGHLRREVARAMTIKREREIAAWEELYGGAATPAYDAASAPSSSPGGETAAGAEPVGAADPGAPADDEEESE